MLWTPGIRFQPVLFSDKMWKFEQVKNPNRLLDHVHLSNDRMSAKIYPNLGGSLQSLKFDQVEVIDGIQPNEKGLKDYRSAFMSSILFPFPIY